MAPFIKRNGTTYRFSSSFADSTDALIDAKKWRSIGHKAIVIKSKKIGHFYNPYDVYYSVKASEAKKQVGIKKHNARATGISYGFGQYYGDKKPKKRNQGRAGYKLPFT